MRDANKGLYSTRFAKTATQVHLARFNIINPSEILDIKSLNSVNLGAEDHGIVLCNWRKQTTDRVEE